MSVSAKKRLYIRRRIRIRNRLRKVARGRPRLSVFRSNRNISVQLIDDAAGRTVASASSLEKGLGLERGNNVAAAEIVGRKVAERAVGLGYRECYFDRGGFLFHGRIKALADAARKGGLEF